MFANPDAVQLVELAASINLHLSHKEAELYLPFILDAMHAALESGLLTAVYALVYLLFRQRFGDTPTKIQRYA